MTDQRHDEILTALAGRLGEHQVFGQPVQQGATTLVPVARIRVGGGRRRRAENEGTGVVSHPVGAWSIREDGTVCWHPAVDINRIVRGGQFALAAVLVVAAVAFRRRATVRRSPGVISRAASRA
ncbi:hypothetical protein [Parasphingorhabdus pacifica]